jgi:hypothetical protein
VTKTYRRSPALPPRRDWFCKFIVPLCAFREIERRAVASGCLAVVREDAWVRSSAPHNHGTTQAWTDASLDGRELGWTRAWMDERCFAAAPRRFRFGENERPSRPSRVRHCQQLRRGSNKKKKKKKKKKKSLPTQNCPPPPAPRG